MSRSSLKRAVDDAGLNDKRTLFGGIIMSDMDIVGGQAVMKHVDSRCFTAGANFISFKKPLYAGELYIVEAFVSGVGNTSVETYCQIYSINETMEKRDKIADGFYTFVPIGLDKSNPIKQPVAINEFEQSIMNGYDKRKRVIKTLI